jgi:hypothetical protein
MRDWARRRCEDATSGGLVASRPAILASRARLPQCAPGISPGQTAAVSRAGSMAIAVRLAGLEYGRPSLASQRPATTQHHLQACSPPPLCGNITHESTAAQSISLSAQLFHIFLAQMSGFRGHGRGGGGPPKGLFVDGVWHCMALMWNIWSGSELTAARRLQPPKTGSPL